MTSEPHPPSPVDCAARLKVLAVDVRFDVVRQLMKGERSVADLQTGMQEPIEQSLLSHHLKVLRDAGLVDFRRQGKRRLYRLHHATAPADASDPETPGKLNLGCCSIDFDHDPS